MKPVVAILKTSPGTIIEDYAKLMELAQYKKHLDKKKGTIIKLNLSWTKYFPACSTQPWQLEGVLKKLKKDNYKEIYPVEHRTVVTDPIKGAIENKWLPVLKKYNTQYRPLTKEKWVKYKPKNKMLALDTVFSPNYGSICSKDKDRDKKSIHKIPELFVGKNVIHLPTLKTHGHTTMTGAIKNAFGGLITERRHHCHKRIHEVLVDLLQIQKEIHPGILGVMDGTIAGDGKGPRTMEPKETNLIMASTDQVALDSVAAHLMGFDPMKIGFIRMAHERGLGCADLNKMEFKGMEKKEVMKKNLGFTTGKSPVVFFDQLFRKGPLKRIEPWLFHTKAFKLCVFASGFYHDRLWYNTIGRKKIKKFNKTKWGKLWQSY